ncbi:MAG TPA: EamA family transporter [Candidatus Limivivens intestinipullorum]|uniref:EamA family transporter n=1 Tax=Candidatus Limivivens intestinipullorum TaxID=2840858 RepID=A0A9D1ETD6_9FIRM|nr:EamA family transporter [Candidatus Limivivens intestinipullorum]
MSNPFILIMAAGALFSAISQLLLKQSANQTHESFLKEYLNWRVITAYGIFCAVLAANTYAYTRVDMKYGSIIDTLTYVFVFLLSVLILKEPVTKRKLLGNLLIVAGIFVYGML